MGWALVSDLRILLFTYNSVTCRNRSQRLPGDRIRDQDALIVPKFPCCEDIRYSSQSGAAVDRGDGLRIPFLIPFFYLQIHLNPRPWKATNFKISVGRCLNIIAGKKILVGHSPVNFERPDPLLTPSGFGLV